jgi:sarcosine oxidase subunit gamma
MTEIVSLPQLRVTRLSNQQILSVRVHPARAAAAAQRLASALSLETPASNLSNGVDPRLCWLSPVSWMVVGRSDIAAVREALGDQVAIVYDASEDRVVFRVDGGLAADLLAKGSSLDLHARVFPVGRCSGTRLAQTLATFDRATEDQFLIYADISFAAHLERWLRDAAHEFQTHGALK